MTESYAHVPDTLKNLPNWVTWRLIDRNGKMTKIPYRNDFVTNAESNNPATWSEFQKVKGFDSNEKHGIGFMFDGSGIVGIDLDDALSNGEVIPYFRHIVDSLPSYTEISPSGTGLHIFVRCKTAPYEKGRRKNNSDGTGLEIYSNMRYFTVTGKPFGNVREIREYDTDFVREVCNTILEPVKTQIIKREGGTVPATSPSKAMNLSDEKIIEIASNAKNGEKFKRIFSGTEPYPSESDADFALACSLAFYTQDTMQIDRIMRSSGLVREKWSRPDYIPQTIANALSKTKTAYEPKPKHKYSGKQDEIPEYTEQQRGWFERNGSLHIEVIEMGDVPKYSYAVETNGEISFIDEIIVEEPKCSDTGKVEVSGLKYVPRRLNLNKDGQPIFNVGIPLKSEIRKIPKEEMIAIKDEMRKHILKYCDLPDTGLDIALYYIIMSWYYPKLNTVPYLRYRADTGKGKSRILQVVSDLSFYPVGASGASTPAGTIRFNEIWHGTLVIDESDIKGSSEDGGYTNDMIKYLNLGFEKNKAFIKSDKANPKDFEIFDPFCPKIIAMRGIFQDAATEGRCLSVSPSETERTDIPPILPNCYTKEVEKIRGKMASFILSNWNMVSDEDEYPSFQDVVCEPRLKQLGSPMARILMKVLPDGLSQFKHYIEMRQTEVKEDRSMTPFGAVANAAYDWAVDPNNTTGKVSTAHIAEVLGLSSHKVTGNAKDMGFKCETPKITVPDRNNPLQSIMKTARVLVIKDNRTWREIAHRYIIEQTVAQTLGNNSDVTLQCPTALKSNDFINN